MNAFLILKPLFNMLWWFLPLIVLLSIAKTPRFKGFFGELLVRLSIIIFLNRNEYRTVHNVTLPTPDGTTQIDHIIVSRYGVFVVETKNYSGWIFGGENQRTWTQKLFKSSFKFQNPLHQNYKHLKALENLLGIPLANFHSVIVFVGGSTFKTEMPPNVITSLDFIYYIKSKYLILLSSDETNYIYTRIISGRLAPSFSTTREHIRHIKNRDNPDTERLCPHCGNPMVVRTAKSGSQIGKKFWGCSQFPKCRAIQQIT